LLVNDFVLRSNPSVPEPAESATHPRFRRNPWSWVPSLYFAEGIPYAMVTAVSIVMYKELGISNAQLTFYTSWLSLPWVLKPIWSPVVDLLKTRRLWIWIMQFIIGACLAGVALTIPAPHFFRYSLVFLFLLAFSSATHDIAADGFYMLGLSEREQSFFSGIRNTSYRIAAICAQGLLVIFAGTVRERTGNPALAWSAAFGLVTILFLAIAFYHHFILPKPDGDQPGTLPGRNSSDAGLRRTEVVRKFFAEFLETFVSFFRRPKIVTLLLFLLSYRFAEAQLLKLVVPFLLDPRAVGGLGLTDREVGLVYGTIGIMALLLGGMVGGFLVSRHGLRAWIWPIVFVMHLPDLAFIFLSYAQPQQLGVIALCIGAEQFGYGFGFTAYTLYMIYIVRGEHRTAHFAICTGLMALGLMLPGMWSGWLQERLGYQHFFIWVVMATIPGFIMTALIPLDRDFGKRGSA
jgi:PAT family beta-lactamase induction signal transducer AmpG